MPTTAQLQPRTSPTNVWFPTPENRDEINGPGGTKDTPCNGHAIGLASLDLSRALVMCDDGTAMSTRQFGQDVAAGSPDSRRTRRHRWERSVLGRRSSRGLRRRDGAITDRKKRQPDARSEPVVLLASMSLPVKWPSMSPATAQSGCGVATESSSQETMARHGSDDGRSGEWLSWATWPDPAPR